MKQQYVTPSALLLQEKERFLYVDALLLQRHKQSLYVQLYVHFVGLDFVVQELVIDDDHYLRLHIWDTAGSEKFDAIARQYYRLADAVMVVFDWTNRQSFDRVSHWLWIIEEVMMVMMMVVVMMMMMVVMN